ncbi:MAG: pilus assembly protein TadG-related protein, partial [Azoarcus sp.]|nr:pilus assembly protein TadG-related protein [Azoarcus sp.]
GQAIYLALAAIVFLSLMTFATWNISQMTHGKTQTMNAADAGAYTLANTVARNLNFMAYTNRAMVANQVVVGQLVSMASLGKMIYTIADDLSVLKTIGQVLEFIPPVAYIGQILYEVGDLFEQMAEFIDGELLPALETIISWQNELIAGISSAQIGVAALSAADMLKAEEVIKANDKELEWALADGVGNMLATTGNVKAMAETFFDGFTGQRDGDARFADVVRDSRDGFTKRREWMFFFHGGTDMGLNGNGDQWVWLGMDGVQFRGPKLSKPWESKTYRYASSGAIAGSEDAKNYLSFDRGGLDSSSARAAYGNRDKRYSDDYGGLQKYWELEETGKAGENPSPDFVVLVYKPIDNTGTPKANKVFHTDDANNPFHLKEGRTRLYGAAAAQAFFRSPAKNDRDPTAGALVNSLYPNGVYASLFSPYWQPRLTDLPTLTAAALATIDK